MSFSETGRYNCRRTLKRRRGLLTPSLFFRIERTLPHEAPCWPGRPRGCLARAACHGIAGAGGSVRGPRSLRSGPSPGRAGGRRVPCRGGRWLPRAGRAGRHRRRPGAFTPVVRRFAHLGGVRVGQGGLLRGRLGSRPRRGPTDQVPRGGCRDCLCRRVSQASGPRHHPPEGVDRQSAWLAPTVVLSSTIGGRPAGQPPFGPQPAASYLSLPDRTGRLVPLRGQSGANGRDGGGPLDGRRPWGRRTIR